MFVCEGAVKDDNSVDVELAAARGNVALAFWYITPCLSRTFFATTVREHPVSISDFIQKMILSVSGSAKW